MKRNQILIYNSPGSDGSFATVVDMMHCYLTSCSLMEYANIDILKIWI